MKAIAVHPGQAGSLHRAELPKPSIEDVPDGRGVLVKVLRVGFDGTDREIEAAEYGQAPEGFDFRHYESVNRKGSPPWRRLLT